MTINPKSHNNIPIIQAPVTGQIPFRTIPPLWLACIGMILIATRMPFLGHLLSWDEAWNLNALRSYVGNIEMFTMQLWRHPPLYMLAGFALDPMRPGFDWRMAGLSLGLTVAALLVFLVVVARLFGRRISLLTGIAYILMPSALFFDTWIKRDPAVTLFGILAILATTSKHRRWMAGPLLGLAMLSKSTAVFYCMGVGILFMVRRESWRDKIKQLAWLYGSAFVICSWWYLGLDKGGSGMLDFFLGRSVESEGFYKPWWYYLAKLRYDLGWSALLFFCVGIVGMFVSADKRRRRKKTQPYRIFAGRRYLPLYFLLPSFLLLSLSHGKPAWITISLNPFLALAVAIGWQTTWNYFKQLLPISPKGALNIDNRIISPTILIVFMTTSLLGYSYIKQAKRTIPKQAYLMKITYTMADATNSLAKPGESLLMLPMLYRSGSLLPNPIFYWNLQVPIKTLQVTDGVADYATFKELVIAEKFNWVMFSPDENTNQLKILNELLKNISAKPHTLFETVLIRVDELWRNDGDDQHLKTAAPQ